MARTPLMRSLISLARDVRAARSAGLPVEDFKGLRADGKIEAHRLSRRSFLHASAAAGAALCLPGEAFAKLNKKNIEVAIVGGGIAGLAAAARLDRAGVPFTVYEASARAGGRMFTYTGPYFGGQTAEWCGELIDSGHTRMRKMAKRYGLKLVNVHKAEPKGSQDTYRFGGAYYSEAQATADMQVLLPLLEQDLDAAGYPTSFDSSTAAGQLLDQLSVRDWIDSRVPGGAASPFGTLLDIAYAGEYGADTTDQSALNLLYLLGFQPKPNGFEVFGESDEVFRIKGGNEQLPERIAADLGIGTRVLLGHRMTKVSQDANGVTLVFDTPGGTETIVADFAILALPFAVLTTLDLGEADFDALKLQAIQDLGQGRNGKLQLQFAQRVWNGAGAWPGVSNGASYFDLGLQSCWDATRGQKGTPGILNVFTGGAATTSLTTTAAFANASNAGVATDAAAALAQLDQVFPGVNAQYGGKAISSLPHLQDTFGCSYSYYRVGQYTTFGGYEKAAQARIHFAGEHCSQDFQGFMEGALREGERAAKEILVAIKNG
ncbi:MAG: FAD-dependent oxidoreductase [Planctomycetes bacterium]|nr:FAD-dependent oxidoreductase [Planctomycetota bacterium]MCC7168891.1 FAD-dependent oxidoreductase [Planctomycetota bacterium]